MGLISGIFFSSLVVLKVWNSMLLNNGFFFPLKS